PTIPFIPGPETLNIAMLLRLEMPFHRQIRPTSRMPTIPFIPGPETLNIAMLLRLEMPFHRQIRPTSR
nr:hypothetical protein [Klebsiella pneumoniae]